MSEASRRWKDRAWKMARRESWRGESSKRVGEENGLQLKQRAPGKSKWKGKRMTGFYVIDEEAYILI